jgi:hypothetical protein
VLCGILERPDIDPPQLFEVFVEGLLTTFAVSIIEQFCDLVEKVIV